MKTVPLLRITFIDFSIDLFIVMRTPTILSKYFIESIVAREFLFTCTLKGKNVKRPFQSNIRDTPFINTVRY